MSSLHSRGVGGALAPSNDQGRERHVLERKHGIPNKNNISNESESTAGTTARVTVPGPRQAAQQLGSSVPLDDSDPAVPQDLGSLRAYSIEEVCRLTNLGRTSIYKAIKSGQLIARYWGRRTLVLPEDCAAFLRDLPTSR
jgi:excisionase family DNA binding protein